jgi:hypothetical protein
MTAAIDTKFKLALGKFIRLVQKSLLDRGNKTEKIVVTYGPRWAKVCAESKNQSHFKGRRAMYFIDTKSGYTYGQVREAASWAAPRKYFIGNIFNVCSGRNSVLL